VLSSVDFPVVLPSANLSGQKEIVSADLLQQEFGDKIDLIVENTDGGFTNIVSTVIDLTYYPFKILREAAIDQKQIIETFACKRIIFVCEGNTCRSPIAQMLFKKRLFSEKPYYAGRIEIFSRGISAFDGSAASRETVDLLAQHDNIVAYDFVSSRLQRYDILSADYIFVMQQSQQEYIISEEPAAEGKVFCLGQFLYDGYQDIPDPMGHGIDEYQDVYSLIKESVKELIDWF
ncbi:MAG: Sua5/YciO/YrdC/YwlC family protein, partial [Candidatus Omnitrophota bacterium]